MERKRVVFILTIFSFIMVGSILITMHFSNEKGSKKIVSNFIVNYYNIESSELDIYEKFAVNGSSGPKKEFEEYKEKKYNQFEKLLTKNALQKMKNERSVISRLRFAHNDEYIIQVDNIKVQDPNLSGNMRYHEAIFTLIQKDKGGNIIAEREVSKKLYLSQENKNWKINEFNKFEILADGIIIP